MSRRDILIGILLGAVLGLTVIALFVFLGGEETIDAPAVDSASPPAREREATAPGEPTP